MDRSTSLAHPVTLAGSGDTLDLTVVHQLHLGAGRVFRLAMIPYQSGAPRFVSVSPDSWCVGHNRREGAPACPWSRASFVIPISTLKAACGELEARVRQGAAQAGVRSAQQWYGDNVRKV